jgi:phosphoadenosine phosphosulfate reductase
MAMQQGSMDWHAIVEQAGAQGLLGRAAEVFEGEVALACSFGLEDVVLLDMALRTAPGIAVFCIDTGRLPEPTYAVAEAFRERGAAFEWYFPAHAELEALQREQGPYSFRSSLQARRACCEVRKLEPLRRALHGRRAWITGLRRDQGVTRSAVAVAELDRANGGKVKLNPLAGWSLEQVWAYVRQHRLPYNRLHDEGYPSIGCAPCTRAVGPGEDLRAGRWWWELPEHKECGLHARAAQHGPLAREK